LVAAAFAGARLRAGEVLPAGAVSSAVPVGTVALARGARVPAATVFERFGALAAGASGAGWSAGTQVPSRTGFVPLETFWSPGSGSGRRSGQGKFPAVRRGV
jgi:hypothetical protein